jgi:hypothetical protein
VRQVAAAFSYPLRAGVGKWVAGSLLVLLWPLAFILLLGYAIAAVRASAADAEAPPPPFGLDARLLHDGAWTALVVGLITLPFAAAWWPFSSLFAHHVFQTGVPFFDRVYALVASGLLLGLPWGAALLVQMPGASVRFAASGRGRDLFDVAASLRGIRERYAVWNLTVVGIVTAWIVGLLGSALCCVGVLPGVFYAILVSAHASAALAPPHQPAR